MAPTRNRIQKEQQAKEKLFRLVHDELRKQFEKQWAKHPLWHMPGKFAPSGMHLTTREAADFLNLSPKTLQNWRIQKRGPAFRKYENGSVRYDLRTLQKWAVRQRRTSTSEIR